MTDRPTSEVLDLAADMIEKYGWKVGCGWRPKEDGGVCLEGGIAAAMGIDIPVANSPVNPGLTALVACPAYMAVEDYLADSTHHYFKHHRLYDWNDHHAHSQQRVVEVLRGAAAVERVKEHKDNPVETTLTAGRVVAVDA